MWSTDPEPVDPWNEWIPTRRLCPHRTFFNKTWRRYIPDGLTGLDGRWEYATDVQLAHWGLRKQAGLPDATLEDAYD